MLLKLRYIRQEKDGRLYVRRKGRPAVRLHAKPGTAAFAAEYAAALEGQGSAADRQPPSTSSGSLAWLCQLYMSSPAFRYQLRPSSQSVRRRALAEICRQHGSKPFAQMAERHVRAIRDAKAGKPEAANTMLKALRALFKWAVEEKHAQLNPAKAVPKVTYKSDGFHTWTADEVERFEARWEPGTRQRLALALLLYTGARRSDVVRLGRQMVRDGWLTFKTVKNGQEVTLPVLPELQAELDRAPLGMTFLITAYGKPFTAAGFGMRFREWCNEAGLHHCSAHGLRKAGATRAAEAGASEKQLNALFGWGDDSNEARRYTRTARRKTLAGEAAMMLKKGRA
jgi:integrase